jgi:integrase
MARLTIGRFGEWTVENAREEARQLKAAVGRGEDPLSQRQTRRQAPDTAPTVADLAARHDRFAEPHRGCNLTREELGRIGAVLAHEEDITAVAAFKLCLFTGARPGEVASTRWEDLAGLLRRGPWVFVRLISANGEPLPSLRPLWERVAARAELPAGHPAV